MLILSVLGFSFMQYDGIVSIHDNTMRIFQKARQSVIFENQHGAQSLHLVLSSTTEGLGIDPCNVDRGVEALSPNYILALNSYLLNFCKYKNNDNYERQCDYFQRLMSGDAGYEVIWKSSIEIPLLKLFFFDPEMSYTYYFLKKQQL